MNVLLTEREYGCAYSSMQTIFLSHPHREVIANRCTGADTDSSLVGRSYRLKQPSLVAFLSAARMNAVLSQD